MVAIPSRRAHRRLGVRPVGPACHSQPTVPVAAFLLLLCGCWSLCCHSTGGSSLPIGAAAAAPPAVTRIKTYSLSSWHRTANATEPGWARWETMVDPVPSSGNGHDDTQFPEPVGNFTMPFFGAPAARLFADNNGFVSLLPFNPCVKYFCGMTETGPSVQFTANGKRGGDIPVVALFAFDLNPAATSPGGGIFFSASGTSALVEWRRVPRFARHADPDTNELTAQVRLSAGGEIVMRWPRVPHIDVEPGPSVGLIYTRTQRLTVPTPVREEPRRLMAMKFTPELDDCAPLVGSCGECIAAPGCVWCEAPGGTCVHESVAGDYCPSPTLRRTTAAGGCDPAGAAGGAPVEPLPPQEFYRPVLVAGSPAVIPPRGAVAEGTRLSGGLPAAFSLPFDFPFFSFPPPAHKGSEAHRRRLASHVVVFPSMILKVAVDGGTGTAACSISGACEVVEGIALFGAGRLRFDSRTSEVTVATLPPREISTACATGKARGAAAACYCPPEMAAAHNGTHCAEAALIVMSRIAALSSSGIATVISAAAVLDAAGAVLVHYVGLSDLAETAGPPPPGPPRWAPSAAPGEVWAWTPTGTCGLFGARLGGRRAQEAAVPWPLLGRDLLAVYRPVPGCLNCGGRGYCDAAARRCVCSSRFAGESCGECAPGYWGAECEPCQPCRNGGACDDGINATGRCRCAAPWSGEACDVRCGAGEPVECAACDMWGGYCECGRCVCSAGWHGATCSRWLDPCERYSLDGCNSCVMAPVATGCEYCMAGEAMFSCASTDRVVRAAPGRVRCGADARYMVNGTMHGGVCQHFEYDLLAMTSSINIILVVLAFALLALMACVGVVILCCCRAQHLNPLQVAAVAGIPDLQPPRREREAVHMHAVDRARHPGLVQGIPLRQIPLKELHEWQIERRQLELDAAAQSQPAPATAALPAPPTVGLPAGGGLVSLAVGPPLPERSPTSGRGSEAWLPVPPNGAPGAVSESRTSASGLHTHEPDGSGEI